MTNKINKYDLEFYKKLENQGYNIEYSISFKEKIIKIFKNLWFIKSFFAFISLIKPKNKQNI